MPVIALHSPLHGWKKSQPKVSPFVSITLESYSESDGHVLLSAQLMTDAEIDHAVDARIKELEQVRKAAKAELRTLKARIVAA